jgi:large subunit ribosomal protein L32e
MTETKAKKQTTKKTVKSDTKAEKTKANIEKKASKSKTTKETPKKEEAKETGKKEAKESKKEIKKKKFFTKEKKANKTKSKEAKNNQEKLEVKKKLPTFRGRFGKKNIRRKAKTKWQKWRKPRSIDLDRGLQHGYRPKIGYRNVKEIRGIHPSGYVEVRVENLNDLKKVDEKINAIRIGATVGKRKRNEIVKEANKKGIWILN